MTDIPDILIDKRTIESIGSEMNPEVWGWSVGGSSGTTSITCYAEYGGAAWFAVYVGDEIRWRVPASDMVVKYAPGPQPDGAS